MYYMLCVYDSWCIHTTSNIASVLFFDIIFLFLFLFNAYKIPSDTQDKYALLCLLFGRVCLSPYCLTLLRYIVRYILNDSFVCSIAYISFHIIKVSRTTNEKSPKTTLCLLYCELNFFQIVDPLCVQTHICSVYIILGMSG